jgi:hypothetical protein
MPSSHAVQRFPRVNVSHESDLLDRNKETYRVFTPQTDSALKASHCAPKGVVEVWYNSTTIQLYNSTPGHVNYSLFG